MVAEGKPRDRYEQTSLMVDMGNGLNEGITGPKVTEESKNEKPITLKCLTKKSSLWDQYQFLKSCGCSFFFFFFWNLCC